MMGTQSVQEHAIKNYQENITYLQKEHPRVYQKIVDFEKAVDAGYYEERYELEYKESYFDVREKESGKYLYGIDSLLYARKAADTVNYKKEEATFKTFYEYYFSQDVLERIDQSSIEENSFYAYARTIDYTTKIQPPDAHLKRIHKFIFFGTGLGTHLVQIDRKIKASNYLIVEDDLELFRLSLFVTNYALLGQGAKLFLCIFEDEDSARSIFDAFLDKSFYYNQYIKYFQMNSCKDEKVKAMQTVIAGQRHLIFRYNAYFKVYLRALSYIKEGYYFLDVSREVKKRDLFAGKPVIIVAAGPSAGKNIAWLKKHQDRFVVVALTAALSLLEKNGIRPDIVTHLDPFEDTCMVHIDKLQDRSFIEDAFLICGSQTPKQLIEMFDKERVFIPQVSILYKKRLDSLEPLCVGSFTYMTLIQLGVRELYTLGLDLALDPETGVTHTKEHTYANKLDTSKTNEVEDVVGYLSATVKVKGNFREETQATLTFYKSICGINNFTRQYKAPQQNVYNLNDGAFLEGFQPTRIESVSMDRFERIDKKRYMYALHKRLIKHAQKGLSEEEMQSMQKRKEYVEELIAKIEKHRYPKSFHPIEYQRQLLGLVLDILDEYDHEAWDLHNIYLSYLHFILPYIFDMLNTAELEQTKKHIKKVHPWLIRHSLEIAEYYREHIVTFFEEEEKEVACVG